MEALKADIPLMTTLRSLRLFAKQIIMSFAWETVRRYGEPGGLRFYSIRRRNDGLFQIVHDGAKLPDGSQPYWMEDQVFTGIYATVDVADEELQRLTGGEWVRLD